MDNFEMNTDDLECGASVATEWGYEEHIFPNPRYTFYVKKRRKEPTSKWVPHWHENLELLRITSGKANVSIDGELFSAKAGDIVVVNSSCTHRLYPTEGPVEYDVIIAALAFCNDIDIDIKNHRFNTVITDEKANELVDNIVADYNSGEKFRLALTKSDIIRLLVHLFKNHESTEKRTSKEHVSSARRIAQTAMEYIHLHYAEDIGTSTIAKELAVSVNYLCRCFNLCTGFTVIDHLNYVRCTTAKAMLSNTRYSVSEVAAAVGFNNLSYFGRQYKRYFGYTPSKTEKVDVENL